MQIVTERDFPMAELVLDDEFTLASQDTMVGEIAESIASIGLLSPVLVEDGSNELVAGRRRTAATMVLKQTHIRARIVRFDSQQEKEIVKLRENLDRRELTADERLAYRRRIAELEEQIAAAREAAAEAAWPDSVTIERDPEFLQPEIEIEVPKKRAGAPSKGRKEAAKKLGIGERQLRRDISAKPKDDSAANGADAQPVPPIQLFGVSVPSHALDRIAKIVEVFDAAAAANRRAMGSFRELADRDDYPRDAFQSLYNELKFASVLLRDLRPAWVCLDCKWLPSKKDDCPRCAGNGYIVQRQTAEIPDELKRTGEEAGVFVRGKFTRLSEIKS